MIPGALRGRRAIGALVALVLVLGSALVAWRTRVTLELLRGYEGSGVVRGEHDEPGPATVLDLEGGGELRVIAIASRIGAGDRVEKRLGEIEYEVDGRRVNPLATIVGSLIFFWIFLPILAFLPVLIVARVRG